MGNFSDTISGSKLSGSCGPVIQLKRRFGKTISFKAMPLAGQTANFSYKIVGLLREFRFECSILNMNPGFDANLIGMVRRRRRRSAISRFQVGITCWSKSVIISAKVASMDRLAEDDSSCDSPSLCSTPEE